ncbi:MAG: lipid-A-disaccharide synthase-related protein [Candidatus Margulisiibacteriota bacterium]|jgi:uncharacterized protein (TIGR03492 family)
MKKILVISNGKGEDSIAVTILQQLRSLLPANDFRFMALPVVSDGSAYSKAGIEVLGPKTNLPSGGFGFQKFSSFIDDMRAGLVLDLYTRWRALKDSRADYILAFGDIVTVLLALVTGQPVIHIGTAYSVHLRKIFWLERYFFLRCSLVLCRDEATAVHMRKQHIKAVCLGNAMMDDPLLQVEPADFPPDKILIALVPSSRLDAYTNLQRLLEVAVHIPEQDKLAFIVSAAPNLDQERLKNIVEPFVGKLTISLFNGKLGTVISRARIALGMTGTGNEQVAGLGKAMVLLNGGGPQSNSARLIHYQKLLGEAVFVPQGSAQEIGRQISALLIDESRLARIGQVGRERMGIAGAAEAMAKAIKEQLI